MNEAIKLAIEKGGYEKNSIYVAEITQDPLFWQALGKVLGWGWVEPCEAKCNVACAECAEWNFKAHQYFDLILTGGNTEKFWKDLLN